MVNLKDALNICSFITCCRLMFIVFVLPFSQSVLYCTSVGVPVKNMNIAVKNDESSLADCHRFNVSRCILDEESNQTMSCVLLEYLESLDYDLVSMMVNFFTYKFVRHLIMKNSLTRYIDKNNKHEELKMEGKVKVIEFVFTLSL